jgi:hypothetical protein
VRPFLLWRNQFGKVTSILEKEQTMHTHETDRTLATTEQLAILAGEIHLAVVKAKPSAATVHRLLGTKAATRKTLVATLTALGITSAQDPRLAHSQQLWTTLGIPIAVETLDDLTMPDIPKGWTGVAIIPPISSETLFALCARHFPLWKYYDDLDDVTAEQERPNCAYVLGHRGGVEPDIEHRGKSYDQCAKEGLTFLTLKERICIELLHFAETGKLLDKIGFTITSTLALDGDAFCAHWRSGLRMFRVFGCRCRSANAGGGPRQAVFA